jgi:hypothetical protein
VAQYLHWLADAVHLDFGRSIHSGASVTSVIAAHFRAGVQAVHTRADATDGHPGGMLAGLRRGSAIDSGASGLLALGFSAPGFALGIVLLFVFGVELGWFPVYHVGTGGGFFGRIYHLIFPAVAFSIFLTVIVARQARVGRRTRPVSELGLGTVVVGNAIDARGLVALEHERHDVEAAERHPLRNEAGVALPAPATDELDATLADGSCGLARAQHGHSGL